MFPSARSLRSTRTTPGKRLNLGTRCAWSVPLFLLAAVVAASTSSCAQTVASPPIKGENHPGQTESGIAPPAVEPAPGTPFQTYRPTAEIDMHARSDNPFVGSWKTIKVFPRVSATQDPSRMVIFAQYMPNGNFRSAGLMQGGYMNGARLQLWGKYTVRQTGEKTYVLSFTSEGILPHEFCTPDGQCRENPLPEPLDETEELQTPDLFHSRSTLNGSVTEFDQYRSAFPEVMTSGLAETVQLPIPKDQIPVLPAPRRYFPYDEARCDDLQQWRICTVNEGSMYTDKRGCKICVSSEDVKSGKFKPDGPPDTKPPFPAVTPY